MLKKRTQALPIASLVAPLFLATIAHAQGGTPTEAVPATEPGGTAGPDATPPVGAPASEEKAAPAPDENAAPATSEPPKTNEAPSELAPKADSQAATAKAASPGSPSEAPKADAEKEEPSLWPLKLTTSMFSRFEARANYDVLGVETARSMEGDATFYRARFGVRTNDISLVDGWKANVLFEPQASGRWGVDGTTREHALGIFQAYLHFGNEKLSFEAGRFPLNYGDGVIMGDPAWRETGRAFDGVRSRYKLSEKGYIDAFVTQAAPRDADSAEGHPTVNEPLFAGDSYFWGVYAGLGPEFFKKAEWDVYVIGVTVAETKDSPVDPTDPTLGTLDRAGGTEFTFGSRIKHQLDQLDYRFEGGFQAGQRPVAAGTAESVRAFQVVGEVGYAILPGLRLGLEGGVASGDDPATEEREDWDALHPNGHRWLGLMDIIGARTNIATGVLRLSAPITKSLKAQVDAHVFSRLEANGFGQVGPENFAGYEVDSQLMQKIGGPLQLRGLYSAFIPGKNHYIADAVAHYVEAELAFNF